MSERPERCEPADTSRDGWHWLRGDGPNVCVWWDSDAQVWDLWSSAETSSGAAKAGYRYLMPVPAPKQIKTLVEAAREVTKHPDYIKRGAWIDLTAALASFQQKDTADG